MPQLTVFVCLCTILCYCVSVYALCELTESGDELLEVDQSILVLVQESEESG